MLGGLHASICHHHQLNSAFVSDVHTRHCQFLKLDVQAKPRHSCKCNSCARLARCSSCDTVVKFDEQVSYFGRRTLRVNVYGKFHTSKIADPTWTSQLVQPSDFGDLRLRWSNTLKVRGKVGKSNGWCPYTPRTLCCDKANHG